MEIIVIQEKSFTDLLGQIQELSNKLDILVSCRQSQSVLNNAELCKLLQITPRTAQRYRDRGLIEFTQIGRKVLYSSDAVSRFMSAHHIKSSML